ncbi:MAG: hypothetical protein KKB62_02840 [Nanoarchaeota archaeon]|nr:hypothetical protein [Nanoarchaeota archaeon]
MARINEEKRNKKKSKFKEKKKHPYKSGGRRRTSEIDLKKSQDNKNKKN